MNLYHLSQSTNLDYDTFDSCVVAAPNESAASRIHPDGYSKFNEIKREWERSFGSGTWAVNVDQVKVRLIGKAADDVEFGVVCASFNAG